MPRGEPALGDPQSRRVGALKEAGRKGEATPAPERAVSDRGRSLGWIGPAIAGWLGQCAGHFGGGLKRAGAGPTALLHAEVWWHAAGHALWRLSGPWADVRGTRPAGPTGSTWPTGRTGREAQSQRDGIAGAESDVAPVDLNQLQFAIDDLPDANRFGQRASDGDESNAFAGMTAVGGRGDHAEQLIVGRGRFDRGVCCLRGSEQPTPVSWRRIAGGGASHGGCLRAFGHQHQRPIREAGRQQRPDDEA